MAIEDFNHIKDVLDELDTQRPGRFGYTEAAVAATGANEITALHGVYLPEDSTQINSIPTPDLIGMDALVYNIGLRSQAATITRHALSHFFGRLGLNLLKLTEKVKLLTENHLVNRYITPSGNVMEDVTMTYATDHITLVKHRSPLSASAPVTASAAITLLAAVPSGNAGLLTGADKAALDNAVSAVGTSVQTSGNQTVNGIKTFGSIPVLPSSDPTTDDQAARKAYVDTKLGAIPGTDQRVGGDIVTTRSTGVNSDLNLGILSIVPGMIQVGGYTISKTALEAVTIGSDLTEGRWYIVYLGTAGVLTVELTSATDYTVFPLAVLDSAAPVNSTKTARYKSGDATKRVVAVAYSLPTPPAWGTGPTYARGAIVTDAGLTYVSIQNNNNSKTPASQTSWWTLMGTNKRVFAPKVYNLPETTFGSGQLGDVTLDGTGLGATATPLQGKDTSPEYEFNNLTITGTCYCGANDGASLSPVVIKVKGVLTIGASGQLNGDSRGLNGASGGAGITYGGAGGAGGKSGRLIYIYANKIVIQRTSGIWLTCQGADGSNGVTTTNVNGAGGGGGAGGGSSIRIITNSKMQDFYKYINTVLCGKGGNGGGANSAIPTSPGLGVGPFGDAVCVTAGFTGSGGGGNSSGAQVINFSTVGVLVPGAVKTSGYIGKGGGGGLYSSTASYTSGGVGGQGFGAGGGGGGDNGNSTPAGAGGDMVDQKYPINEFLIIDNYDSREAI